MHFKVNDTNVRIDLADEEIEPTVIAIVNVLIPRVADKIYFLRKHDKDYSRLTHLSQSRGDFCVLDIDQPDRTFLRHFRIVESDGCLYIAPNRIGKIDRGLWRSLCEKIKDKSRLLANT